MPLSALRIIFLTLLSLAVAHTAAAQDDHPAPPAPIPVVVAGYEFEPYVTASGGLTPDLVAFLNEAQATYRFEFLVIPAQRRYRMMETGKVDVLFFEMPRWGWAESGVAVEATPVLMNDAEIFVARREQASNPGFFETIAHHRIAAVRGFHYRFAGFEADSATLTSKFDLQLVDSQPAVMRLVEGGMAEVGIVARSFLIGEMLQRPALLNAILVSPEVDQIFRLPALTRKDGPISAEALTALLQQLHDDGRLPHFFATRGLGPLYVWPGDADASPNGSPIP
ncbi:hypothetical protein [Gimibacter soli]|uniref:Uncharacterized protein n=1 Tax=Gimibacter soli TaxID=3024400 RepID=A0AAE9XW06_9PROT|nr:hypothetical protein [Gimibacter soli]WCL55173.1 hypothetical protein PH603_05295 [Gimibacter soli]